MSDKEIVQELDICDLDLIFLSYDEPQKEEFWLKIKNDLPWATRVDGVYGSDAAHKAAARASETERFILVDGDNLPDLAFFDKRLRLTTATLGAQFRWRSRNFINGMYYGNGGISSWTREYVLNMRTHEASDGSDKTRVEFCFDPLYIPMYNSYSVTYPNYSPRQAWRAGFREGVKLCTRAGTPPKSVHDFQKYIWPRNARILEAWQTLGRDVENGFWAILGARCGTHYLMLRDWDYTEVRDFKRLDELWELHRNDDEAVCAQLGRELNKYLGCTITEVDAPSSAYFKRYIQSTWHNRDIMLQELEVVRTEEGW